MKAVNEKQKKKISWKMLWRPENDLGLKIIEKWGTTNKLAQEPITRSLQLPRISVTAFSQTDLFLVWIYNEFRSPQEPQWPIAITGTD